MKKFTRILSVLLVLALLPVCSIAQAEEDRSTWLVDEPVTVTIMRSQHANQEILENTDMQDELYRRTGIRVIIEPVLSDYTTKASTIISGGGDTMPDIMYGVSDAIYALNAPIGAFACLDDYPELVQDYLAAAQADVSYSTMLIDGKNYSFNGMYRYADLYGRLFNIREDILAETGMAVPTTFDELLEVLRAIKALHPDVYPVQNRVQSNSGTKNLLLCWAYALGSGFDSNGVYFDPDIDGGRYVYGPAHENFLKVMEYLSTMYAEGLLDPDYALCSSQQWTENLSTGKGYGFYDNPKMAWTMESTLKTENPDAVFIWVPLMENSFGQTRQFMYRPHSYTRNVISADSPNVEACMKLLNYFFTEEGCDLINFGVEGQNYTKVGDEYIINPDVAAEALTYSDAWRTFQSWNNLGSLGISIYIDNRNAFFTYDERTLATFDAWRQVPWDEWPMMPILDSDDSDRVSNLLSSINTQMIAAIDNCIMGEITLDEFKADQEKAIQMGALEIEEIYNKAIGL